MAKDLLNIIAIGDIHGSTDWKEIVKAQPNSIYIFLGDYLDPYREISEDALIDNLKEIVALKKENPENVVLLLGNHDVHYFSAIDRGERYNMFIANEVRKIFREKPALFQNAFQIKNLLFTHAGVSQLWFDKYFKGNINENIADQLNNPTLEQEAALEQCGRGRGGNLPCGGIFWAYYLELEEPLRDFIQIVGHTSMDKITEVKEKNGTIWLCDALAEKQYLKISGDLQNFEIEHVKI